MRKIFISKLFYFILGIIISSGITVYAATTLLSKDIGFVPDNSSWEVNNVQDALNDLYSSVEEPKEISLCAHSWTANGKAGAAIDLDYYDYRYLKLKNFGYQSGSNATVYFTDESYNTVETELDKEYDRNNSIIRYLYITESISSSYGWSCVTVEFYN